MKINPEDIAYVGGFSIGAVILLCVCFVYVKQQRVDSGAISLAVIALSLVGLSIWKGIDVDFSTGKLNFQLVDHSGDLGDRTSSPNLGGTAISAITYKVAIANQTELPDADVEKVVDAIRQQIDHDFAPHWGISASLTIIPKGSSMPDDAWPIFITENSNENMVSYHTYSESGRPSAKIFLNNAISSNVPWSASLSHEIINLLTDPRGNLQVLNNGSGVKGYYYYEPTDPCGGSQSYYQINGVTVSDFVFPSWFEINQTAASGKLDLVGQAKAAFQLCSGGWAYVTPSSAKGGRSLVGPS